MKRSNIDAMICKQECITEITRDEIHRIQLEKLNIVLKREKEREGFYRDLPERLESLTDLRSLPFTTETFILAALVPSDVAAVISASP